MWLTDGMGGTRKIWIHPDCIEVMVRSDFGPDWPDKTTIRTKSGSMEQVKETPEEILEMVKEEKQKCGCGMMPDKCQIHANSEEACRGQIQTIAE